MAVPSWGSPEHPQIGSEHPQMVHDGHGGCWSCCFPAGMCVNLDQDLGLEPGEGHPLQMWSREVTTPPCACRLLAVLGTRCSETLSSAQIQELTTS